VLIAHDLPPCPAFGFAPRLEDSSIWAAGSRRCKRIAAGRSSVFLRDSLLKDGQPVQIVSEGKVLTDPASDPGTYRIEAYRRFLGRRRAWIFSNPIYVT
jgi:hypothetical protein